MYENEIWKPIEDYEGLYEVSNYGRVRSLKHKAPHILTPTKFKGYDKVWLSKNRKVKSYRVHRLVAQAFIPNPDNLPTVDHIDRDTTNNYVENLRWATSIEQAVNQKSRGSSSIETKLKVICVETGMVFNNSAAAAHWILDQDLSSAKPGTVSVAIRNVCKKDYGYKSAYGYHWEFYYKGEDTNE